ncbi:MAG: alpha/beta hydrolase [Akkermansiaceae bacterium]
MIRYLVALSMFTSLFADETKPASGKKSSLGALAEKLLGKNGANRLFYYPTKTAPDKPSDFGHRFEDVTFKSEDGTKLHGWFFQPFEKVKPKGTVVFHHGNAGSVGYHIGFVGWMARAGYQVLLYDYRGYGKSEGEITRRGLVQDARAAINFAKSREDVDGKRMISFGHSLGGAKSLAALGEKMIPGVRGVVCFAGFASYQDMARKFAGETGTELVSDELSARDLVEKISPISVLIAHGTKDATVPLAQGEILFKKAKEPKTIYRIPNGSHTRALWMNDGEYRAKILVWMEKTLKS